jgi:hypothetical protein
MAASKAIATLNMAGGPTKLPEVPVPIAFMSGIVQWLLGAAALALIAFVFGKTDHIKRLIACDNWITLWFLVLEAPFNIMSAMNILTPLGSMGGSLLAVFSLVITVRMLLFVLKLPFAAVVGVIIFMLLLQLSLLQLVQGLAV